MHVLTVWIGERARVPALERRQTYELIVEIFFQALGAPCTGSLASPAMICVHRLEAFSEMCVWIKRLIEGAGPQLAQDEHVRYLRDCLRHL